MALGAVLLIGAFSYSTGQTYLARQAAVLETLASRDALAETLSLMKDAETGVRGFLLTADEKFLEPYDDARPGIERRLARLGDMARLDSSQRPGVDKIARLAHQELDLLGVSIRRGRAEATIDAEEVALLNEGKRVMDATRVEVAIMIARTDARLEERERATAAATKRMQIVLSTALVVGVLVTMAGFAGVRREMRRALEASGELIKDIAARKDVERALRDQTRLLESVFESMGDGVVVVDRARKHTVVNPAARRFLPWSVGETAPSDWSQASNTFLPDGKSMFPADRGPFTLALRGECVDGVDLMVRTMSGELRSYSVTARPITSEGVTVAAVGVFRDTTSLRQAENDLLDSENRYRVLAEASFEGMAITRAGQIVDTNANFARWMGYESHEMIGMPGIALFAPADRSRVTDFSQLPDVVYEATLLRRDGTSFPAEVRGGSAMYRGDRVRIATIRDVTEKKAREAELLQKSEQLRALSLRDDLTGLYNRRGFIELAEHQMKAAVRARQSCVVFFADLDGMKQINDQLGHEVGDHAIMAAARVLSRVFRASDVVSRLGGDEFAVFASDCDEAGATAAGQRLEQGIQDVNAGVNASSQARYRLSISVGAAFHHPGGALDLAGLMEAADLKMYSVKRAMRPTAPLRLVAG